MDTIDEVSNFSTLRLLGGRLCLDYVNTINRRYPQPSHEYLNSYSDLVYWGQHVGVLDQSAAADFIHTASMQPDRAQLIFDQAILLREALHRIFFAAIYKHPVPTDDLALFNASLSSALSHLAIYPAETQFDWRWIDDSAALDRMLWPVIRSAADLLTSADLSLVCECPREHGCGWLFVDTSKNHSRRWCSMESCGNVAKARRHAHKQHSSGR